MRRPVLNPVLSTPADNRSLTKACFPPFGQSSRQLVFFSKKLTTVSLLNNFLYFWGKTYSSYAFSTIGRTFDDTESRQGFCARRMSAWRHRPGRTPALPERAGL